MKRKKNQNILKKNENILNDSDINIKKENLYSNRIKQKIFARTIGGGAVALLSGIFLMNFILIILGIAVIISGVFMGKKYKDEIKWK